jgi:hypothetical protein
VRAVAAGVVALLVIGAGAAVAAEPLPQPSGPVILAIGGAIEQTNAGGEARFDRAMLEALGSATIETSTVWTDGVKRFEGVPLRKVLERVGARGTRLHAQALNDYEVVLPVSDLQYDPLLAMRMDGRELTVRDRGPLWIVYPRDALPALRNARQDSHWVWQLRRLVVE